MSVLNLAISLGILCGFTLGIWLFSRHCRQRFGYSFFTIRGFWLAAIAINFLWWGYYFWATAPLRHTPSSGGFILMAMGIAVAAWLIYENVRDTDLLHGIGGASLQLVLFFPVALYGIPLLLIATLFLLFATYKGPPAWFVDP
ncbi:hypothetical protein [Caballeronia sordidicola]|uniref:hypothetical protein n=1 Tax=Caballeronia sordidicola TaxID=196367 RepID=UPI0004D01608|nr:hypothetical protein [Caballeronia sordidicola]